MISCGKRPRRLDALADGRVGIEDPSHQRGRILLRKILLRQLLWRAAGERTEATGEILVKIGWRDGREVEQRVALEMDLVRRENRTVISRLLQRVQE